MSRWLRFRWSIDRIVALLLAVPCAPVIAVLAFLIRRHDPGRAIVRLTRVGQDGKPFEMLKLRSMKVAAPGGHAGGSPITFADDDRITPLGRRLRRLHIDELPQLLNVGRGQMSLLGPRPETPSYVDGSDPRWVTVLKARPGIAGATQLLVRDWEATLPAPTADDDSYRRLALPVKLDIDAWYVATASPGLDLQVLRGLVQRLIRGRRRTVLHSRVPAEIGAALAGRQDAP